MDTTAKYVVISTKPLSGSGSRVFCMATNKENAEKTKTQLENHERTKGYGPFEVISYKEAERRRLYGE